MTDIQYPENGKKNVNLKSTDLCGNTTREAREVNIIQKLKEGKYIFIDETGDTAIIRADVSSDYYNKSQINELLADLDTVQFKVVNALPAVGAMNVIYLLAKEAPDTGYNQYIWSAEEQTFEPIGDTDIDLSDYYTKLQSDDRYYLKTEVYNKTESDDRYYTKSEVYNKTETDALLDDKQDKLSDGAALDEVADNTTLSSIRLDDKEIDTVTAEKLFKYMADKIYPVGSIYISYSSTSPATLFGGTWESINGRFLVGAGSNGASGNEALNLTAGTTGGVYRHQHQYGVKYGSYFGQPTTTSDSTAIQLKTWNSSNTQSWSTASQKGNVQGRYSSWSGDGSLSSMENSANTNLVNNLPPYLTVFMWRRTA